MSIKPKKIIFTYLAILVICSISNAQNGKCVYFASNGNPLTEAKCDSLTPNELKNLKTTSLSALDLKCVYVVNADGLTELKVNVPVPPEVGNFDVFIYHIKASNDDYYSDIKFTKEEIKSKLVGKKEVTLTLLGTDGHYGYYDLCEYPRREGVTFITLMICGEGGEILRYNEETYYDKYRQVLVTEDVPVWDKSTKYQYENSVIKIKQKPLTDGIEDNKKVITITPKDLKSCPIMTYYDLDNWDLKDNDNNLVKDYDGSLVVESLFPYELSVYFLYYKADMQTLKTDIQTFLNKNTYWDAKYNWIYYFQRSIYNRWIYPEKRTKFNGEKTEDFVDVTIEGKEFATMPYAQKFSFNSDEGDGSKLIPGSFIDFYLIESEPYTLVVFGVLQEKLSDKGKNAKWQEAPLPFTFEPADYFEFRLTDEEMTKAQEIIRNIVGSVKFNK